MTLTQAKYHTTKSLADSSIREATARKSATSLDQAVTNRKQ